MVTVVVDVCRRRGVVEEGCFDDVGRLKERVVIVVLGVVTTKWWSSAE